MHKINRPTKLEYMYTKSYIVRPQPFLNAQKKRYVQWFACIYACTHAHTHTQIHTIQAK